MFCDFDKYLKEFETDDYAMNYWYDEGFSIAQDMLEKFTEEDWDDLDKVLNHRSTGWKRRLAYCLHNEKNIKQLNILLTLLNVNDKELFTLCIDSLRSFTNTENKELILNNSSIIIRVEELISVVDIATKKILEDFINKIEN